MVKFSKGQCRSLIYRYFLSEGWLPAGTPVNNWGNIQIGDLQIDDPALPEDPHFQKKRIARDLGNLFFVLGGKLPSPLEQLKRRTITLHQLADWCFENQSGG